MALPFPGQHRGEILGIIMKSEEEIKKKSLVQKTDLNQMIGELVGDFEGFVLLSEFSFYN